MHSTHPAVRDTGKRSRASGEELGEAVAGEVGGAEEPVDVPGGLAAKAFYGAVLLLDFHLAGREGFLLHLKPALLVDDLAESNNS